jgi:hypothetical protein
MKFKLVRYKQNAHMTYGVLFDDQQTRVAVIMERPWMDKDADGHRDPGISRIAPGSYRAIRAVSPKRGHSVWWLCDVPDVSLAYLPHAPTATTCQIHAANFPWELEGCLGIGTAFAFLEYAGKDTDDPLYPRVRGHTYAGISGSRAALEKFMALTDDIEEITLEVVEDYGAPAGRYM